ncbi:MAG: hypothetical protein LBP88_06835 [Treponema sp.]|nr:hypothetical protein [Treponema sp.]
MKRMHKTLGWGALAGLLICSGCAGLVEKAGQFLEGPWFAEKTLGVYRAAPGMEIRYLQATKGDPPVEKLAVSLSAYPGVHVWASAPDKEGRVFLEELHFLGSSYTGWNQFTLELAGEGRLILQKNSALWQGPGSIEKVQISWGKIRRNQKVLSGEEALTALRNRQARIAALTEWMHTQEDPRDFTRLEDFAAYWKPLLMPELAPRKKRPAAWTAAAASWVQGEEVSWNRHYTEQVFPETLWVLRNSGALLRDWEEALPWIYLDYQWDRVLQGLSQAQVLTKIK